MEYIVIVKRKKKIEKKNNDVNSCAFFYFIYCVQQVFVKPLLKNNEQKPTDK